MTAACVACGRPVLGVPWHDALDAGEAVHQACLLERPALGAAWAARARARPHERAAGPDAGWTLALRGADALAVHDSGRAASLTWARVRTIAIGNLQVPLLAPLDPAPSPGASEVRKRLGITKNLPLDEILAALGWSSAIVAPEEVIGARVSLHHPILRVLVPWSVPPAITRLAGALAGRGAPRAS